MLSDPQTINIAGANYNFPLIGDTPNTRDYATANGDIHFITKQNQTTARFRREVRLSQTKAHADPITGVTKPVGLSVYLVIDEPKNGAYSDAEVGYLIDALKSWLSAGNYNRILGGEF